MSDEYREACKAYARLMDNAPKHGPSWADAINRQSDVLLALGRKALEEPTDPTHRERADLGRTILNLQEALHRKNLELDALHYVWCTGNCEGGIHRYGEDHPPLTEEIVREAEHQAVRLRERLRNERG